MAKRRDFSSAIRSITSTDEPTGADAVLERDIDQQNHEVRWLDATTQTELLSAAELERLHACEAIIHQGLQAFIEVGMALQEIRNGKLYRAGYKTFEAYCEDVFSIKRRNAYTLMAEVEVVQQLRLNAQADADNTRVIPSTASHAGALAELDKEDRQVVWNAVVAESELTRKPITAKKIREAAQRLTGKSTASKLPAKVRTKSVVEGKDANSQLEMAEMTSSERLEPSVVLNQATLDGIAQASELSDSSPAVAETQSPDSASPLPDLRTAFRQALRNSTATDVRILVNGSFLLRSGLAEIWSEHRPGTGPINEFYTDYLTWPEAHQMGLVDE